MKAVEFETTVNHNGQIFLPADLAGNIPSGEPVRVVVMWDTLSMDGAWREAGRRKFEEAYCAADVVCEQLAANVKVDSKPSFALLSSELSSCGG